MDVKISSITHGVIVCGQTDAVLRISLYNKLGCSGEAKVMCLLPACQWHGTGNTAPHWGSGCDVTLQVTGLVNANDVICQWTNTVLK